jgi:hypothetical protein
MASTAEISEKVIECMEMDGDTDTVEMFLDQYVEQGASGGDIIVALELAQEKLRVAGQVDHADALQMQIVVQHLLEEDPNWMENLPDKAKKQYEAKKRLAEQHWSKRKQ